MNINIPEKYREVFDRSADFAVISGKFTPKELAKYLGVGELVASIMVGYMEKSELITKGKNDEVRRAKINLEEWERIEKKIENYIPPKEEEKESFPVAPTVPLPEIKGERFFGGVLTLLQDILVIEGKEKREIALRDIEKIFILKPRFLRKGVAVFSSEREISLKKCHLRADALIFKKKETEKINAICKEISEYLGVAVEE